MKLKDIKPNPNNPRTVNKDKFKKLVKSIKEFPKMLELRPIVLNSDNIVLGGNMRLKALKELKYKEIPDEWVKRAKDLTDEEKRRFIIADNVGFGEWDWELLANEWEAEELENWGLEIPGFEAEENEAEDDNYQAPEDLKTDVIKGDLIEFITTDGRTHRLLCGDSTKSTQIDKLTKGAKIDVCQTDPPYGLGDTQSVKNDYATYQDSETNLKKTIKSFMPLALKLCKVVVLTPGNGNANKYQTPTWQMAWFTPAGIGMGPWGFCCWQPILCYGKDPMLSNGKGCHPDALVHTETAEKNGHPCPKPLKFWEWLMKRISFKGQSIYDPFSGSGTTFVAAHQLNRVCYGMELDPKYCQIIIDRMKKLDNEIIVTINGKVYEDSKEEGEKMPF